MENSFDLIENFFKILNNSNFLLITAGAGFSVDSGIPDYYGDEGFWKSIPVLKSYELNYKGICNPKWYNFFNFRFVQKPNLAWAFWFHCYDLYKNTKPHEGYFILKDLIQNKFKDNYFSIFKFYSSLHIKRRWSLF